MADLNLVFVHWPLSTALRDANDLTAIAVTAGVGDIANAIWTLHNPVMVSRVGVQITTAVVYGTTPTPCVVSIDRRRLVGTDTSAKREELGRVTIPESAPLGATYYVNIPTANGAPTGDCLTGDQLIAEVVVQGVGGTGTGAFKPMIWAVPSTEADKNNLNAAAVQMTYEDTTTVQVIGVDD